MKMFWIGMNSYLKEDLVKCVSDYNLKENRRKVKTLQEQYMVSDYSNGKKKESVVYLTNGEAYITSIPVNELLKGNDNEIK